jgi:hypothetical protein
MQNKEILAAVKVLGRAGLIKWADPDDSGDIYGTVGTVKFRLTENEDANDNPVVHLQIVEDGGDDEILSRCIASGDEDFTEAYRACFKFADAKAFALANMADKEVTVKGVVVTGDERAALVDALATDIATAIVADAATAVN